MSSYVVAPRPGGEYEIIWVTGATPDYSVVAVAWTSTRAEQIAALLTEDES